MKKIIEKIKNGNKLTKNYIVVFCGSNISSVLQLIATILIVSTIGNEGNGILVLVQSYCYLCADLIDAQTFNSVIKFMAECQVKKMKEQMISYIQCGFLIDILFGCIGVTIGFLGMNFICKWMNIDVAFRSLLMIYLPAMLFRNSANGTAVGVLRQMDKYNYVVSINAIVAGFRVIIYLLLKVLNMPTTLYVITESALEILNGILLILYSILVLKKNGISIFVKRKPGNIKKFLRFNMDNTIIHSLDLVLGNVSNLIISKYLGVSMLSIYKIMEKISNILVRFISPFTQVIYPHLCIELEKNEVENVRKLVEKFIMIACICGSILTLFMGLTYNAWSHVLFQGINCRKELILFMIYTVITCATSIINPLSLALDNIRKNIINVIIINVLYCIILIPILKRYTLIGFIVLKAVQALAMAVVKYIQSLNKMKRRVQK